MLRKKLSENAFCKVMYRCIKNLNNKEYLNNLLSIESNPQLIYMMHNGDLEISCCYIEPIGKNDGMFAGLRWLLDALYFCDYYSLVPHVKFTDKSIYYDSEYDKDIDPFEYYFKGINYYKDKEVAAAKCVYLYSGRNRLLSEKFNGDNWYRSSNEYIAEMGKIMHNFLKLNTKTETYINDALRKVIGTRNVLGVHIRGTDYKISYKNHPNYINIERYIKEIDTVLQNTVYDKIFLATDDAEVLEQMKQKYGEKLCFFKDVLRSSNEQGIHVTENSRPNHQYLLGLEVLRDMYCLSYCNGLIVSLSQVGLFARIAKRSRKEEFSYLKILDDGISRKNKIFNTEDKK